MGAVADHEGEWISLMDYATRTGVSLSTLRRYIKAGKIPYRSEHGKYLLLSPPLPSAEAAEWDGAGAARGERIEDLETQLRKAREEIAELKMLVAIYEEKLLEAQFPGDDGFRVEAGLPPPR